MKEMTLEEALEDSRIVIVLGYIDSQKSAEIIFKLLSLQAEDEKAEIQIFINSEGGNYLDMMAIYDTIKMLGNHVSGTCIGNAHDYALLLLASCTKGKRYALKHSVLSFSQPYGSLQPGGNQQTEIMIEAKEVRTERQTFEEALEKETKQAFAKIHQDCENGIEFTVSEALAYGIIDEILE